MWHFFHAGVTCSGKLLVTVTGLENDSCKKRKWRNILCTWSLKISEQSVQRYVVPAHVSTLTICINNLAHVKAGVFILHSPSSRNEGQSSVPGWFILHLCNIWTGFPPPLIISLLQSSVTQNFVARGPILASKNSHGSSHPYWRKYSVPGWYVFKINNLITDLR